MLFMNQNSNGHPVNQHNFKQRRRISSWKGGTFRTSPALEMATQHDHESSEDMEPQTESSFNPSKRPQMNFINCTNITFNQKSDQQTTNTLVNGSQSVCHQGLEPPTKRPRLDDNSMCATYKESSLHSSPAVTCFRGEDCKPVIGKVYYVGDIHTYIKGRAEQSEFPVVLINGTDCYHLRVFDVRHHTCFSRSKLVRITNYKKNKTYIFVSGRSKVEALPWNPAAISPSQDVEQEAKMIVKEHEPVRFTKIASLPGKPNKRVNTKGQIVQVSPAEEKNLKTGQSILFRKIQISDDTETINVNIWREMAKQSFNTGETIRIKKAFVSQKNGLSIQSYTRMDKVPSSDDQLPKEQINKSMEKREIGEIVAIGEVNQYKACGKCNFTKLNNCKCPTCGFLYNPMTARPAILCQLSVRAEDNDIAHKVFTQEVKKLLRFIHPNENADEMLASDDIIDKIADKLPCNVRYTVNNENVMKIVDFV